MNYSKSNETPDIPDFNPARRVHVTTKCFRANLTDPKETLESFDAFLGMGIVRTNVGDPAEGFVSCNSLNGAFNTNEVATALGSMLAAVVSGTKDKHNLNIEQVYDLIGEMAERILYTAAEYHGIDMAAIEREIEEEGNAQ
jgi:hypothetical protein